MTKANKTTNSKRPVGTGLKPRVSASNDTQEESKIAETASATEVQEEAVAEPAPGGSKAPETGQALGVQNLESSKESIVADAPEVPQAAIIDLANVMKESAEAASGTEPDIEKAAIDLIHSTKAAIHGVLHTRLGKQANGDFVVALTINEFYVESCKQFAEADKTTLEDWCSRLFNQTLEAYCRPNKGR